MRILTYNTILILVFFQMSCGLNDNEAPIPGYLNFTSIGVAPYGGSNVETNSITDLYVFLDGQIQGVFPLPAKVPIPNPEKSQELTILAGIKNNGVAANPVFYPFYKSFVKTIQMEPLEVIDMPILFEYADKAKIKYYENFESINSIFTLNVGGTNGTIQKDNTDATVGVSCGKVTLGSGMTTLQLATSTGVRKTDVAGGASYVEFDYKGDGVISVGILKRSGANQLEQYKVFVPCKNEWNKIYIDFADLISPKDFDDYRILLGFSRKDNNNIANIQIDNLKHWSF
ncbi:MAG: hypothetical protein R2774_15290 [Saprospiraceae bacterium]